MFPQQRAPCRRTAWLPQGYKILPAPSGYQPIYTPARKLMATPTPGMLGGVSGTPLYSMPADNDNLKDVYGGKEMPEGLPELKMEDMAVSGGCKWWLEIIFLGAW